MSDKLKLGVIFGGKSEEHVVSIMSAQSILKHVNKEKFLVYPIGICRNGTWIYLEEVFEAVNQNKVDEIDFGKLMETHQNQSSKDALAMLMGELDVVFPVLHGPYGEDGTIQGLFEMMDIPYVGADVKASALCMDKVYSKQLLKAVGIPVVDSLHIMKHQYQEGHDLFINEIDQYLTYPMFVKPANLGSSVGISKVKEKAGLHAAIMDALKYDSKVLVEKGIDCREVECAILGNEMPKASVVGEILPSHEFYDFEAKYFDDGHSKMVIPAPVSETIEAKIQEMAIKAYQTLGISGLSRIDFFVDKESQAIYLNEINTLPGFTQYSMYPLLWAESGIAYPDLIERLIELAFEKFKGI